MTDQPDSASQSAEQTAPSAAAPGNRFDRRQVLMGAGVIAASAPVAYLLRPGFGRRPSVPAAQQSTATVVASPTVVAGPPVPSVTVVTDGPLSDERFGQLEVIRDPAAATREAPGEGGVIRVDVDASTLTDWNPATAVMPHVVTMNYLEPLLRVDPVTMEPTPWLAQSWTWEEDGTALLLDLRHDLRWHDGEALTAADVQFSWYVYRDDINSGVRNLFLTVTDIRAVDRYTVRAELSSPDGGLLFNAATLPIFNRAQYIDQWESEPAGQRTLSGFNPEDQPLGSGIWRIETRDDNEVRFVPHTEHWAVAPAAESLRVRAESSDATRRERWRNGDTDLLWPVRPADLAELQDRAGRLYVIDSANVMFAAFNFFSADPEIPTRLADGRVRQALSLACDRDAYTAQVFSGFHRPQPAGTIAQPWAYSPESVNPMRDLAAARQLLAEAGWNDRDGDGVLDDAFGRRLELTAIVSESARPELAQTLQALAPNLAEVGAPLNVQVLPNEEFNARWIDGRDWDLIGFSYPLYPGFTDFDLYGSAWDIRQNIQGFNPGGYANREVDALIGELLETYDIEELKSGLARLQQLTNDDLFGLWLGFPQDLVATREGIRGYSPNRYLSLMDTRTIWRQS